jgi:hypothetical protein
MCLSRLRPCWDCPTFARNPFRRSTGLLLRAVFLAVQTESPSRERGRRVQYQSAPISRNRMRTGPCSVANIGFHGSLLLRSAINLHRERVSPPRPQKNTQSFRYFKALYSRDSRLTGAHVDPPRQASEPLRNHPRYWCGGTGKCTRRTARARRGHRGPTGIWRPGLSRAPKELYSGDLLGSYRVPVFRVNSYPYGTEVGVARTVLRAACCPATQPAIVVSFVTDAT